MGKKGFPLSFIVLSVILLSSFVSHSRAAEANKVTIRLGHILNTENATHLGAVRFSEIVSKATNGRIEVKVFPASQLGSATAQLANVKMGTQEMFIESGTVGSRMEPDFLVLLVPFLVKDQEQSRKIYTGPLGQEIAEKLARKQGIRVLASGWDRTPRQLLAKPVVAKLGDLKGLKIRVPANPIFLKCWKALGAAPTPMEFSEIYLGLQQGTIDGVELPLDLIYMQKFHEIAKNLTLTNHYFEECSVFANEKSFQGLQATDRKVIVDALQEAGRHQNMVLWDQLKEITDNMKKQGVVFHEWSASDREQAAATTAKVGAEEEDAGKWSKGLISRVHAVK